MLTVNSSTSQQLHNIREQLTNHFKVTRTQYKEMDLRHRKALYDKIKFEYPGVIIHRIEELVEAAYK